MTGLKMIGLGNCPITLSDNNFADKLMQNTTVYAPATFEEIVMVMIKTKMIKKKNEITN